MTDDLVKLQRADESADHRGLIRLRRKRAKALSSVADGVFVDVSRKGKIDVVVLQHDRSSQQGSELAVQAVGDPKTRLYVSRSILDSPSR